MAAASSGSSAAVPSLLAKGSRGGRVGATLVTSGGGGSVRAKDPGSPKLQGATGPASPDFKIRGQRVALQASNPPKTRIATKPKMPAPNTSVAIALLLVVGERARTNQ